MHSIPSASDINNFIVGNFKYMTNNRMPDYQLEQVKLREFLCSNCLENGKCILCGCKTPNMFYAPLKKDEGGKWAEFMSEAQWLALKNNYKEYAKFFEVLSASYGNSVLSSTVSETASEGAIEESTIL